MRRTFTAFLLTAIGALLSAPPAFAADSTLTVSATSVALTVGSQAQIQITNANGRIKVANPAPAVVSAKLATTTLTLRGLAVGKASIGVSDRRSKVTIAVTVSAVTTPRRHHPRHRRPAVRRRGGSSRPMISACIAPIRTTRCSASCRRSTWCTRR